MIPIALSIAGSDPSGGAGIQADLKTFSALGVYGAAVVTALTAQNTLGVQGVHDVPADFVALQLAAVFEDLAVGAVKIGMLSAAPVIEAVAEALVAYGPEHVVLDPVMVAASGAELLRADAVEALKRELLPRASVITPNLPEAARLLGVERAAADEDEMLAQARALRELGARAVLLKGGHGTGETSVDLYVDAERTVRLAAPRVPTRSTHGTGCTLSSALAAGLAAGLGIDEALLRAKDYVTRAIRAADSLQVGRGTGPVHHFHSIW